DRPIVRRARSLSFATLLALAGARAAHAREVPIGDAKNPRNVRFDGRLIPFVADSRRIPLVGAPATWPPRSAVRWMAAEVAVPDPAASARALVSWQGADVAAWVVDGHPREVREERKSFRTATGATLSIAESFLPWVAFPGRHLVEAANADDRCVVVT